MIQQSFLKTIFSQTITIFFLFASILALYQCLNPTPNNAIVDKCEVTDANGDGKVDPEFDVDADGYTFCSHRFFDCNDNNPFIHPEATEVCNDGVDNNCDGKIDLSDTQCQKTCDIQGSCDRTQGVCAGLTPSCVGNTLFCDYGKLKDYQEMEMFCNDNLDNDCDGIIDTDDTDCQVFGPCTTESNEQITCKNPKNNKSEGVCKDHFMICLNGYWTCEFEKIIGFEDIETEVDCNDNDCDGKIDETNETFAAGVKEGSYSMTKYYLAQEEMYDGPKDTPLYKQPGTDNDILKMSTQGFYEALKMEGSGFTDDDRLFGWGGQCQQRSGIWCFTDTDRNAKPWGGGAAGALIPFYTIAVNPDNIPYHTVVYISEIKGKPLPGNNGFHTGCVEARDTGGAFLGNPKLQLDFYVGPEELYSDSNQYYKSPVTVKVPTGSQCANFNPTFTYNLGDGWGEPSEPPPEEDAGEPIDDTDNTEEPEECYDSNIVCCCENNVCAQKRICDCTGNLDVSGDSCFGSDDTDTTDDSIPSYCK